MEKRSERRVMGGPCEYRTYPGEATILSVRKPEGPARSGLSQPTGYEVRFSFSPRGAIQESWVRVEGKEHLLLLANSAFPGPGFLKKYGIESGKCFECNMRVITRGTCTPILFEFPAINLNDYSK